MFSSKTFKCCIVFYHDSSARATCTFWQFVKREKQFHPAWMRKGNRRVLFYGGSVPGFSSNGITNVSHHVGMVTGPTVFNFFFICHYFKMTASSLCPSPCKLYFPSAGPSEPRALVVHVLSLLLIYFLMSKCCISLCGLAARPSGCEAFYKCASCR